MTVSTRSWLPAYLLLALIWGGSFCFIKLGLLALTPAGVAVSRLMLGLATMLVISAVTRTSLPPRRAWLPLFVAALLMTSVPWILFGYGEQHISSALAGIINGATPLMTLVAILLVFPEEKPTRTRMAGVAIGFAGVLIVMGVWQGLGAGTWVGIAACTLALGCLGCGIAYALNFRVISRSDATTASTVTAQGLLSWARMGRP